MVLYLTLTVGVVWLLRPSEKGLWSIKTPTPGELFSLQLFLALPLWPQTEFLSILRTGMN